MATWILAPLATLAVLGIMAWLVPLAIHRFLRDWCSAPAGGSGYNPLQEIVQPEVRHVVQVQEQRLKEDEQGGPP